MVEAICPAPPQSMRLSHVQNHRYLKRGICRVSHGPDPDAVVRDVQMQVHQVGHGVDDSVATAPGQNQPPASVVPHASRDVALLGQPGRIRLEFELLVELGDQGI